ncbi:hypothetical protein LOK49_LG05G00961 [Camellia lanceoleosa]|uniref:Uncharacterized protein n=1 Tax=Camellia lanceoleosa TaxID=1840588 RepID=A0ACC0HN38_9ERIC|nr:hypothetical protein LOK49_LG05G00961 [Camellia lanceoleosa]
MPSQLGIQSPKALGLNNQAYHISHTYQRELKKQMGLCQSEFNYLAMKLGPSLKCSLQFLKEILNMLCVYNKRGTNQGTYELKPEYKKSVEDTGAE